MKQGDYVIVRCTAAGVHSGVLVSQCGQQVELSEARRLWYWQVPLGAPGFLSGVATHGLDSTSKTGTPVSVILTEACEIIACTPIAETSIRAIPSHVRTL